MASRAESTSKLVPPIQMAKWAELGDGGDLLVRSGPHVIAMCNSDGTGTPLVKHGLFGADVIRFGPNEGVMSHTHAGDHILFVIKGCGFVEYDGVDHVLEPGVCYLVPGTVDHAIKATSELVLIAVGNDHRPLDSDDRMVPSFE